MKRKTEKEFLDRMHKDPGNWIGPFYFNRKDPRLIVHKIYRIRSMGLGWTFNFASPYTYLFLILVAAIIVATKYLL